LNAYYTWNELNPEDVGYRHDYEGYLTGDYASTIQNITSPGNSTGSVATPNYFKFSGMGIGLDAGLTWRIVMGDKIRVKSDNRIDSDYHLSFSVAVQDVGFVSYFKETSIS